MLSVGSRRTSWSALRCIGAVTVAITRLAAVRGFDAFPMTAHVECVALLVPA